MIKISLIIPTYNVEKYLEKCILSCINQDLPSDEYEIIIVNDGSTDTSLEIATRLAEEYHNIQIISQENKGLSGARNTGLLAAQGTYVWFIDSDDWIDTNCLSEMLSQAFSCDLDVLMFDLKFTYEDGTVKKKTTVQSSQRSQSKIYSGLEFLNKLYGLQTYAWLFIIKRDFLIDNNLSFAEGIYYEDMDFSPRMLLQAKKIKYLPRNIYNYFQRPGSILNSYNPKKLYDLCVILKKTESFNQISYFRKLSKSIVYSILVLLSRDEYKSSRTDVLDKLSKFRSEQLICRYLPKVVFSLCIHTTLSCFIAIRLIRS